jgi:hypothetical protein
VQSAVNKGLKRVLGSIIVPSTSDLSVPLSGSENEFKEAQRPIVQVRVILNVLFFVSFHTLLLSPNCNSAPAGPRFY